MADTNTHEHLYDLVKDFDTVMLVTKDAGGKLHARPMSVAELRADADAYFATSLDSPKIDEIEADPMLTPSLQWPGDRRRRPAPVHPGPGAWQRPDG